jgi:uncharacterized LabA/DUF88 family protein
MLPPKPKTIVYVDGFNLYYRALKNTNFKWLDLDALFTRLLPKNDVIGIKFYTANVSAHIDPGAPARQQVYLDALQTLPTVKIIKGSFMSNAKWLPIVPQLSGMPDFRPVATTCNISPIPVMVSVMKVEEKGSDVNLGAHLVYDACTGACDVPVIVTNDTDLVEPMRIVRHEVGLQLGLVTPVSKPHTSLKNEATFIRHLKAADLNASQFPPVIIDAAGNALNKPATW